MLSVCEFLVTFSVGLLLIIVPYTLGLVFRGLKRGDWRIVELSSLAFMLLISSSVFINFTFGLGDFFTSRICGQ
ncbi:hypothetical protein CKO35_13220 [Ectothiorhodospira shaposhnikovii]|nr:hypothetical protein [Ectothiorhodospira shaposhnikovii]